MTQTVIDVSSAQGEIDWSQVAAVHRAGQIDGVILKASEGTGYTDRDFEADLAGARSHGVPVVAVYHFPRPDLGNSGRAEGEWFAKVTAGVNAPRIVDIERHPSCPYDRWVQLCTPEWLWELCEAAGVTWSYGNAGDLRAAVRGDHRFAAHRVWLADYPSQPDAAHPPTAPAPWNRRPDMWQFSDNGHYPGIGGSVDRSWAYTALTAAASPAADTTAAPEAAAFISSEMTMGTYSQAHSADTTVAVAIGKDHRLMWCMDPGGIEHIVANGPSPMDQLQGDLHAVEVGVSYNGHLGRFEATCTDQNGQRWGQYLHEGTWTGWAHAPGFDTDPELLRGPKGDKGDAGAPGKDGVTVDQVEKIVEAEVEGPHTEGGPQ